MATGRNRGHTLAIHTNTAESVDVHLDVRDIEALLKTGALQLVKPMKFQDFLEAVRQVGAF